jgi:hypothetical protein
LYGLRGLLAADVLADEERRAGKEEEEEELS